MTNHAECLRLFRAKHLFDKPVKDALDAAITALAQQAGAVPEVMTHQKVDALYQQHGEKLPFSARHFYCRGFNACREQVIASSAPGGGGEVSS